MRQLPPLTVTFFGDYFHNHPGWNSTVGIRAGRGARGGILDSALTEFLGPETF